MGLFEAWQPGEEERLKIMIDKVAGTPQGFPVPVASNTHLSPTIL